MPFGLPQRMGLYEARNLRRQYGGGGVSGRLDFLRGGRRRGEHCNGAPLHGAFGPVFIGMI